MWLLECGNAQCQRWDPFISIKPLLHHITCYNKTLHWAFLRLPRESCQAMGMTAEMFPQFSISLKFCFQQRRLPCSDFSLGHVPRFFEERSTNSGSLSSLKTADRIPCHLKAQMTDRFTIDSQISADSEQKRNEIDIQGRSCSFDCVNNVNKRYPQYPGTFY